MTERLNSYIGHSGAASRRKADGLITAGHVFVNEIRVTVLGTKIDPATDVVRIDDLVIKPSNLVYYALSKPIGVVSSRTAHVSEPLVTELVPADPPVVPVGRLDKRSSGLMILTNDGPFAYELTHPKFVHEKEYEVTVRSPAASALPLALARLGRGVRVEKERLKFDRFTIVHEADDTAELKVILHTGKKRQIRRMAAAVGLAVTSLHRIRIEKLSIGTMKPGEWKVINKEDVLPIKS